jgi:acetyl-CoA C-acetyltransferase
MPGKTANQVQAEGLLAALDDAGLSLADVDGLCCTRIPGLQPISFAEYLGIYPTFLEATQVGGSAFVLYLIRAMEAIATGRARVVAIAYASLPTTEGRRIGTRAFAGGDGGEVPVESNFEAPWGLPLIGTYALCAARHMHQYGTKPEQLAWVGVTMRKHAGLNPNAKYRDPITVQDVLNSRLICDPLHLLDCCIISDGGGAIIVAHPDVAKSCKTKPVWLLGAGEAAMHTSGGHRDFTVSAAAQSGPVAFKAASVQHKEIDLCMIYDAFSINVLMTIEDLGFCKKGEGGAFVENGGIGLGGRLPVNPDGGGLSSCHPGMRGMFLLVEATRQLRGDFRGTPRQVPNAKTALVHGVGGFYGTRHSGITAILTHQ